MDDRTERLALALLHAGQAQKELSHNEALTTLDLAVQASVLAAGQDSPPAEPEPGACWLLGDAPEGAWAGHAGAIAGWTGGGWRFVAPFEGLRAWVVEDGVFALFSGGAWSFGEVRGRVIVDGEQVVGARSEAIEPPSGGATIDSEARAAIAEILLALEGHGLIESS